MRIESVTIDAFGPLESTTLDLAPGMTVLTGRNESAKSTWHAATYAALCGRKRGKGRGSQDEQDFERRHRPWDRSDWMVRCVVVLDDGRRVELRQDLAGKVDCRATDLALGRDISGEIMFEGSPDALRWCGLNRRSYLATGCVRQTQLLDVLERADGLQEHLQQAAATGGTSTAAAALRRLREAQREHVGSSNAPTKPLRSARDGLARTRAALEGAQASHTEYVELCEHGQRMREEAAGAAATVVQLEAVTAADAAHVLRRRLDEVQLLLRQVPSDPGPEEDDDRLAQRVAAAVHGWRSSVEPGNLTGLHAAQIAAELAALPPPPEGDLEPAEGVRVAQTALQLAQARLQECSAQAFSGAEPVHSAGAIALNAAEAQDFAEATELVQLAESVDERPLEQQALTLQAVRESAYGKEVFVASLRRRRTLLGSAAIGALLPAITLLLIHHRHPSFTPIGVVLAVIGVGVALLWLMTRRRVGRAISDHTAAMAVVAVCDSEHDRTRRRREEALRRCAALGMAADPSLLRKESALRLHARDEACEARARELSARGAVRDASARLLSALAQRGVEIGSSPVELVLGEYVRGCGLRAEQARAAERAQSLRAQLQERERSERAHAQLAQARKRALGELQSAAAQLRSDACAIPGPQGHHGLAFHVTENDTPGEQDTQSGARLVAELEEWSKRRTHARAVAAQHRTAWNRLRALLRDGTVEMLSEQVDRAELEAARCSAAAQELDAEAHGASGAQVMVEQSHNLSLLSPEDVAQRLGAARSQASRLAAEADRLEGMREERERSLASVAVIEEEMAADAAQLQRIEDLDATLQTAITFLEEAQESAHRDIAPVLNATVASWLPLVTTDRYQDVTVDPQTLEVRVRGRDGTALRRAQVLSRGTAEQVYLLLRLALTQHLGNDERCPILLDDVSVQTDGQRTAEVLELLHRISGERQVVLFARQERVADWARATLRPPRDSWIALEPVPSV